MSGGANRAARVSHDHPDYGPPVFRMLPGPREDRREMAQYYWTVVANKLRVYHSDLDCPTGQNIILADRCEGHEPPRESRPCR